MKLKASDKLHPKPGSFGAKVLYDFDGTGYLAIPEAIAREKAFFTKATAEEFLSILFTYPSLAMTHFKWSAEQVFAARDELCAQLRGLIPSEFTDPPVREPKAYGALPPLAVNVTLAAAPVIAPGSWLREERFADFVKGYEYASTQHQAIIGLSKLTPEEAYHIVEAINRGRARA